MEYLWADGLKVKTPMVVSAPSYVGLLEEWVSKTVHSPSFGGALCLLLLVVLLLLVWFLR